jgi:hypothetical protein
MADCDFCATAPARWFLPAKPGTRPLAGHDEAGWLACATCHRMISASEKEALLQRSRAELVPRVPVTEGASMSRKLRRTADRDVAKLHAEFWRQRNGSALPSG